MWFYTLKLRFEGPYLWFDLGEDEIHTGGSQLAPKQTSLTT